MREGVDESAETKPVAMEGRIVDEDGNDLGDAGFHADILGQDLWPEDVLERMREDLRARGLNPDIIQR